MPHMVLPATSPAPQQAIRALLPKPVSLYEAGASRAPPTPSPQARQRDASGGPGAAPTPLAAAEEAAPPPLAWVGFLRKGAAAVLVFAEDGGAAGPAAWPPELQISSRAEAGGVLASLLARPRGSVTLRRLWPATEEGTEARRAALIRCPPAIRRPCCRRRRTGGPHRARSLHTHP